MANRLFKHYQLSIWQKYSCHTCYVKVQKLGRALYSNIAAKGDQAIPHTGFYADILSHVNSQQKTPDIKASINEATKSDDKAERLEKAKVVFGSRLLGPAERQDQIDRESRLIAGVLVPPRPSEPDNCCMSGCVNCVWDRYREDLEEWTMKSNEARNRLKSHNSAHNMFQRKPGSPEMALTVHSMDDDGGGSENNWDAVLGSDEDGDLLKDVPIGIREFMKIEKSLKEKRQMQKSSSPF